MLMLGTILKTKKLKTLFILKYSKQSINTRSIYHYILTALK